NELEAAGDHAPPGPKAAVALMVMAACLSLANAAPAQGPPTGGPPTGGPSAGPFPTGSEFQIPTADPPAAPQDSRRPISASARRQQITPRSESNRDAAGNAGSLWTTFASLAAIIVVLVVAAKLWKKHGPGMNGVLPAEAVEVLGRTPLDPRQCLHVVRCGSRILVLGSSPGGLQSLLEVSDPAEVENLTRLCRTDAGRGTGVMFRSLWSWGATNEDRDESQRDDRHGYSLAEQRLAERLRPREPDRSGSPGVAAVEA
ncbi:MAG: FliO/MopB family protein, partial [Planctomycetaceae bacterium]